MSVEETWESQVVPGSHPPTSTQLCDVKNIADGLFFNLPVGYIHALRTVAVYYTTGVTGFSPCRTMRLLLFGDIKINALHF